MTRRMVALGVAGTPVRRARAASPIPRENDACAAARKNRIDETAANDLFGCDHAQTLTRARISATVNRMAALI